MSIREHIKKQYSTEFFKYSAALLSSNALAQIIGFLVYPVITRLYNPEIFGVFNFLLSIVGILTLLTTGRYELAIVLPKSEKKAVALFQLSLLLTGCITLFFFVVAGIFGKNIAILFHQERLIPLLPYLPAYLLLWGLWQTLNYYFVRQKKYYNISFYNVTQSIVNSGMKCFFGFKAFLSLGLVWGQLLGQFIATAISAISGRSFFKCLNQWDKKEIIAVAKAYSNFPKFYLPYGLVNLAAANLPILLLPFCFDMENFGQKFGLFTFAFTVGFVPVTFFSNSICQVMFRQMSERVQNKGELKSDCLKFCKMCLLFILPFFIFFVFIPDNFFGSLFGQRWINVGFYLKLLLPCIFLSILVGSLSFIPDLFFKQKTVLHIEMIYIVLKAISLLLGVYLQSFDLAIIFHSIVVTCVLMIKLIWYFKLIKEYELSNKKQIA